MVRRMLAVAAVVAFGGAVGLAATTGCGGSSGVPTIDCTKTPPKSFSQLTILTKCNNCHASTRTNVGTADNQPDGSRHGATAGFDYDSYDNTKANKIAAQDDVAGVGLHLMPPSDDPRWHVDGGGKPPTITEQEKQDFYAWVQCGTPQ